MTEADKYIAGSEKFIDQFDGKTLTPTTANYVDVYKTYLEKIKESKSYLLKHFGAKDNPYKVSYSKMDDTWQVKYGNRNKALKEFATKDEAYKFAEQKKISNIVSPWHNSLSVTIGLAAGIGTSLLGSWVLGGSSVETWSPLLGTISVATLGLPSFAGMSYLSKRLLNTNFMKGHIGLIAKRIIERNKIRTNNRALILDQLLNNFQSIVNGESSLYDLDNLSRQDRKALKKHLSRIQNSAKQLLKNYNILLKEKDRAHESQVQSLEEAIEKAAKRIESAIRVADSIVKGNNISQEAKNEATKALNSAAKAAHKIVENRDMLKNMEENKISVKDALSSIKETQEIVRETCRIARSAKDMSKPTSKEKSSPSSVQTKKM